MDHQRARDPFSACLPRQTNFLPSTNSPGPSAVRYCGRRKIRSLCWESKAPEGSPLKPRSGELRTQKLKSYQMRTQSLKVLPLKPGVGQYIAIHATLTARDFFLANFNLPSPFTCIFFPNLSEVFPELAAANTGSCVDLQNKIGYLAGCRFPCWVPAEHRLKKTYDLWCNDFCEMNNLEIERSLCSALM